MSSSRIFRAFLFCSVASSVVSPALAQSAADASAATPAAAEVAADEGTVDEILVTARRRAETAIEVPVAITAVGGEELERRAVNTVDSLARLVPSLITSDATSSPQGGIVAIRGLSGVDANPFGDQAVSFNIDGVQVARSSVRRLSQMDIQQIEVLKGPQALFFGKNSPGGIISIRTGDPTDTLEGRLSAGYEFHADEIRTEGFIAGPLSDTLGFRLAGYFSDMKGDVRNVAPDTGMGVRAPFDRRVPNGQEYALRGTLKWDPSDRFEARLKVSYSDIDSSGLTDNLQHVACPLGTPQASLPPEDCRADGRTTATDNIGPAFGAADPRFGDGETFLKSDQVLAGLELNYDLTDQLLLSSITGYYDANNTYVGSFTANFAERNLPPRTFLPAYADLGIREVTQEVRLTSDFDGAFNFMLGGLYQDSDADVAAAVALNANLALFVANYLYEQEGKAYSVFAQGMVDILPDLELSVGGRYSKERKRLPVFRSATGAARLTLIDVDAPRRASFDDFSPEVTVSYRPSRNLTLYGAYKEGFLSGGFNATQPAVSPIRNPANNNLVSLIDPRYGQQRTEGFEGGIKAALLDGDLRTNFTLYSYKTIGLQVAVLVNLQQELRNAGKVRTRGAEFDFNYRTPLEGLTFNGSLAYLDGEYTDYQATCYRGLAAPQCRTQVNRFTGQPGLLNDLSGTELVRAPDWTGNIGFDYETPITSGLKLGLTGNASFSDSFFTDVVSAPGGRQKAYELYDAGVRLADADDRWELALIGRNLDNTYYFTRSADNPFTGTAPGGPAATAVRGDTVAVPSRGREVMLRATFRFGG